MNTKIESAKAALDEAFVRMNDVAEAIEQAENGADVAELEGQFDAATEEVTERKAQVERLERVAAARAAAPSLVDTRAAVTRHESIYRPDGENSFFRDLAYSRSDLAANERLHRHNAEMRDITGQSGGGGDGFIPPMYLAELAVPLARPGRPFADIVPQYPLPNVGNVITIPKMSTGTTVAAQTEGSTVSKTDVTSTQLSATVRTIAGQQDLSLALLERSLPGIDSVLMADLSLAYHSQLDSQLISGATGSNQHLGLHNISGVNTVTYTDASPTGSALLPYIYGGISQILSKRYLPPTHIVMHPRRAAWLAASLTSTPPLFQQGGLYRAAGTQDDGIVGTFAGLPVVVDPNIGTTYGTGTNQDEIYIVRANDMVLMETPLVTRVFDQVLSGTLEVRIQLFAYSAFFGNRYPAGISVISGTGLVAPSGY